MGAGGHLSPPVSPQVTPAGLGHRGLLWEGLAAAPAAGRDPRLLRSRQHTPRSEAAPSPRVRLSLHFTGTLRREATPSCEWEPDVAVLPSSWVSLYFSGTLLPRQMV